MWGIHRRSVFNEVKVHRADLTKQKNSSSLIVTLECGLETFSVCKTGSCCFVEQRGLIGMQTSKENE